MSTGLHKTIRFLGHSKNSRSLSLLLSAFDGSSESDESIIEAVLSRDSIPAHREILQRYQQFDTKSRAVIEQKCARLEKTMQALLLKGKPSERTTVAELILSAERFEYLTFFVQMFENEPRLQEKRDETSECLLSTFRELVNRLHDQYQPTSKTQTSKNSSKDLAIIRQNLLNALDVTWPNIKNEDALKTAWEAVFILGQPESAAVKKLLELSQKEICRDAWNLLTTSAKPRVIQLIYDFLGNPSPPAQIFEIIAQRSDPEFITAILNWLPETLTLLQKRNLQKIQTVSWLDVQTNLFERIPTNLHSQVTRFVEAIGFSDDKKSQIFQYLLQNGSINSRLAAVESLVSDSQESQEDVQKMICESLSSEDPQVQAWATTQLREQNVPDAILLLLEQLENPLEEVRNAAQKELHSFDIYQMLESFENFSQTVCQQAGEVIQKIDPLTIQKLKAELRHPIQHRQIRAIRGTRALNLQEQVWQELLNLLNHDDDSIRCHAIELLETVPHSEVLIGLKNLLLKTELNLRVRETAERAVQKLHHNKSINNKNTPLVESE